MHEELKQKIEDIKAEIKKDKEMIDKNKRGHWKEAYKFNCFLLGSLEKQLKREEQNERSSI